MSKIAMVPGLSLRRSMICFPGFAISSPTLSITAPICVTLSPNSASGPSRLSNAPPTRPDFNSSHGDGSSNEPSLGSIETAAWPRISRLRSPAPKPGFTSPPCSCSSGDCPANSATYTIKIRTLSAAVHAQMRLHAEIPLVSFLRLVHLGVARLFGILGRRRRIDDRSIDNRAGGHLQPLQEESPQHSGQSALDADLPARRRFTRPQ